MKSATYEAKTGCGKVHVTFEENEKGVCTKILINASRNGNCIHTRFSDYQHLVDLILKKGGSLKDISDCFDGRICSGHTTFSKSCGDAISSAISEYKKGRKANDKKTVTP